MLAFLRSLFADAPALAEKRERAPEWVMVKGGFEFPLVRHVQPQNGYPIVDWKTVRAWVDGLEPASHRAQAWTACERAWLLRFRDALGAGFRLDESDTAAVVSSLDPNVARATLEFMARTARRIGAVLEGIVQPAPWGKDVLVAFDDEESYYRYVSCYYPEKGEFAFSGGMHIDSGCGHFVTVKKELRLLEATIVHEMTHACLEHLPLPAWLNEGLAVNTEHRLAGRYHPSPLGAPERLHDQLRRFWSVVSIQEFWSGDAFHRPDSQSLSYELARIMVEQLASDWKPFAQFVLRAERADAGAAAARDCLGIDLGALVTTLLERETPKSWSPDPAKWKAQ